VDHNSFGGRRKTYFALAAVLLGLLLLPGNAFAGTVWNLGADWSTTDNPNLPWSYNHGASPASGFNPAWDTGDFTPGVAAWTTAGTVPVWFQYAGQAYNGPSFDALTGDVITHTDHDDLSNVTWTSPIDGEIDITGGVWMPRYAGDEDERDNHWVLSLNGALLASGDIDFLTGHATRANPSSFDSGLVAVQTGDVVKLEFTPTIHHNGDFVGMDLNIEGGTPEPSTAWLLAGSVLLLAAKFHRSKRA
jgi:hypothetical protein